MLRTAPLLTALAGCGGTPSSDAGLDALASDAALDARREGGADGLGPDAPGPDASDVVLADVPADLGCGDAAVCAGACVSLATDVQHCGACGNACPTAPHAAPTCASGRCGFACDPGFADCDADASNGCETDLMTDLAHCGACGTACSFPNAAAVCSGGVCTQTACSPGFHDCGGACASNAAVATCGSRCAPCPVPANASATCDGASCGFACNPGYVSAGGGCTPAAPRQIAPLSTATVTSRRPVFHWALAVGTDGAHVEVCRDRACATPVASFDASGTSGAPAADLPPGVLFWRLRSRVAGVTGAAAGPVWQFTVGARSAPVNTSWGTTLDVNGDGFADVVVGASWTNLYAGSAYVYLGGAAGLATTPATTLTSSASPTEFFGVSVASAGDVNGDGFADVLISGRTHAYVYLGGAAGLASTPATTFSWPVLSTSADSGWPTASAGDLNGDGYADVLVGVSAASSSAGRAYVYLGGAAGLATTPATTIAGPDGAGGNFGAAVASAGDANGDGYGDVLIGAYVTRTDAAHAYVYLGGSTGLASTPAVTLTTPDLGGGSFGGSVANAGDVNGDGYADVLVGAYGANGGAGAVHVHLGGAAGPASTAAVTLAAPDAGNFGLSLASAGDLNGDGYGDIAVSAHGSILSRGGLYVYLGGAAGLATSPAVTQRSPESEDDGFGELAVGIGDVNGDGYTEVLTGSRYYSSDTGRLYLYFGDASAPAGTLTMTLTGPASGQLFGGSVASLDARDGRGRAQSHSCACSRALVLRRPRAARSGMFGCPRRA